MEIRIGPPATGPNFYKRPSLIGNLMRALGRGNVAFLGPRRTGKTSCLTEINAHPEQFVPVLLNLERHDSVEGWLNDMLAGLRKAADLPSDDPRLEKLNGLFARVKNLKLGAVGFELAERKKAPPWREAADVFLAELLRVDVPILFLLDEFPTFLKLVADKSNKEDVEAVLNWFRAARNDLRDTKVRFLVTGSIGLAGVVRKLGLGPSINEFETLVIPPLTESEALGLLEALALNEGISLDIACRRRILALLGEHWPILLQMFVAEIQNRQLKEPTGADLDQIYQEALVHGRGNKYCEGMYDRLKEIFTPSECQLAREVLKACCRAEGLSRVDFEAIHHRLVPDLDQRLLMDDELDHVLDTLKHDGYLVQQTAGARTTRMASNILRDYWLGKTS
jgi:hypothetical protein